MTEQTNKTGPTEAQPIKFLHEGLRKLRHEIRTYRRELPRLLAEGHEGRYALIKGDQLLSVWDTFDDACQAGRERFEFGEQFMAQPIDARYLTVPLPDYLDANQTS